MLKHFAHLATFTLPVLLLSGGLAHASDIGGAPVKAIPFETTSSTLSTTTFVGSPFFYGHPQTIIITPVVPYNSITVTTGNTRLELVNPAPYPTYTYRFPGQAILTQPGVIYQRPNHPNRTNHQGSNCRSRLGNSHHRSIQLSPGICW